MLSIVRRNPLNDGSHWYYKFQGPVEVGGARSLSIGTLPPPPSLIVSLTFATQTIFCARPGSILLARPPSPPPVPTESEVFTMDINSFTNLISAHYVIHSMFMSTTTGRSLSPERRFWMVVTLSDYIQHYFHGSVLISTLDANIIFQLEVVDEMDEEIEGYFMHEIFEEWLEDDEEFYEDVEYNLSICPAPPALVESLKTEVYQQSDQEGEAEDCAICLEELVARVEAKRLPCSHCFHVHCIDGWFQRKDTCPLCRTKLQAQS